MEGARMPYQTRAEMLSRRAWVERYKEVAPRIQLVMDRLDEKLHGDWLHKATSYPCWKRHSGDAREDVTGKIDKALSARRGCLHMQEMARTLAPGTMFEDQVFGAQLRCVKESGPGCAALNCY